MVQLKPEIYKMIVESMLATDGPPDFETKLDQQRNLARMMRVSKECLVGDFDLFVKELEPQSRMEYMLNKVTTLRLYHPIDHSRDEAQYFNLLCEGRWEENGRKSGRQDHRGIVTRAKKDKGYADKVWGRTAIDKLDRVNTNRDTNTSRAVWLKDLESDTGQSPDQRQAFARLERVIMAADGCKTWDAPWSVLALGYIFPIWGQMGDRFSITSNKLFPRPIPHYLVGLKSVKHYCQSSRSGPLALKHNYTRPLTSPETVTYHLPEEAGEEDMHLPPILIGSVNRYIFLTPRVIIGAGNGDTIPNDIVGPIVEDLEESLTDENQGLLLHSNDFQVVPLEDIPLDTTTIEVYNYCIHVDLDGHIARSTGQDFEPSDLQGIQAALDGILDGRWRGKIVLKNREDAPCCSACGKDPYET